MTPAQPTGTTTELDLGSEVYCTDGVGGTLERVVIDPTTDTLTDLIVAHRHPREHLLLVPLDLVASTVGGVRLACTIKELTALHPAEETRFVPGAPGPWAYRQDQMVSWPYWGRGLGTGSRGGSHGLQGATYDSVPKGDLEVRRGDRVHAVDGEIGTVHGFVVDPRDDRVTHVLLAEGHLWGAKQVTIPISCVKPGSLHGVQVTLTQDEIRDLPAIEVVHRPWPVDLL